MKKSRYYIGAQNDQLYITYGEPPAPNNDYPAHNADREPVAKILNVELAGKLIKAANSIIDDIAALT